MVHDDPRPGRPRTVVALSIVLLVILCTVAAAAPVMARGPLVASVPERASGNRMTVDPGVIDQLGRARAGASAGTGVPAGWIVRPTIAVPRPAARSEQREPGVSAYKGRNHVWMPALGIDRSVASYACSRSTYPRNRVYRWGCAGSNNVYLFGHAHSVFKPLHDAYVRGKLRKGMRLFYADGAGRVREYAVRWWRVTRPDRGEFAFAAQRRPSLTLQTCVGSRSQYRLIVRLVRV
jgi:hypothetical protein